MSNKTKTYSKDSKQKKEVDSARQYNINWAKKRKALLRKNWQEMNNTYYWAIPTFYPLSWLDYNVDNYINNRIRGTQSAPVYGYGEAYMWSNPDSTYTKKAKAYKQREKVDADTAFDLANGLNGLSYTDKFGRRALYLKQGRSGSAAHELWHVGTGAAGFNPYEASVYKKNPQHFATVKYLKQDPYIQNLIRTKQLNWDKPLTKATTDNQSYVWNPDEVLARRASLMHYLNWDPTKKATLKDVQRWRKQGLLEWNKNIENNPTFYNTPNVNLYQLSDQTILHLINDVALNNTPSQDIYQVNDVQYARRGGLIKKSKKIKPCHRKK